ncbi:helix-turn-helix transcriptional regulator [Paenibacillus sp. LHD-38]|uniref:helix-turn-helix domain-containing protein n=1 Tax=Paenibacillus sp. LHD-38 TaxID=3072143 RepID=UPI00280FDEEA|nr:helix-turn-helix transcriptional regulator [Paenibacillus sp. LHD-38]MDQ8738247.1 helix-turn-helix transcriptional regulator [Paenibacillus sp. LHD-38]
MQNLMTVVGKRIRILRKNRGLTQVQLGELVEIPQSYIGAIERGEKNVSIETLERIVIALEISPEELFISIKNDHNLFKERLLDKVQLKLQERDSDEVEIIHNLIVDVLKAFDRKK